MKFYGEEFSPLLKPGENVYLPHYNLYAKVTKVRSVAEIVHTCSGETVSAGGTSTELEIDTPYQPNGIVAQYRFWPEDDSIEIKELRLGGTRNKIWRNENDTGKISSWTKHGFQNFSQLSEFWQVEDETLEMDLKNTSGSDITSPKLNFVGFAYKLKKLTSVPPTYKTVYVRPIEEADNSLLKT